MENEKAHNRCFSKEYCVIIIHLELYGCKVELSWRLQNVNVCQGVLPLSPPLRLSAPAAANGPGVMSFLVRQLEKNCHCGIYNHQLVDMIES